MATNEHGVVKPQKIVDTGIGLLEQELLIPSLFQKEGIDNYRGAANDTVNVKVGGVLPFHDYEWRSGSATSSTPGVRQAIEFDLYNERTIPVSFGGNVYSAVAVTDEQADMDLARWAKLITPQVKAVARGLNRRAIGALEAAPYEVIVGDAGANLRGALIEARRVMNALNVPTEDRYMVVGSDFEAALLSDEKLALAQFVGDTIAESALQDATLGRKYGFTFVVDQTIGSSDAYAFAGNGFVFLNAAPSIPSSVKQAATQSLDGVSMRWIQDYDAAHLMDRSIVNTYAGFDHVKDILVGYNGTDNVEVLTANEHFVRGIKLVLDGASTYPAAGSDLGTVVPAITVPGKHLAGTATGTVVND